MGDQTDPHALQSTDFIRPQEVELCAELIYEACEGELDYLLGQGPQGSLEHLRRNLRARRGYFGGPALHAVRDAGSTLVGLYVCYIVDDEDVLTQGEIEGLIETLGPDGLAGAAARTGEINDLGGGYAPTDLYGFVAAVTPAARRLGVGRFIVGEYERLALARGRIAVAGNVRVDNEPAVKAWTKHGYAVTATRPWRGGPSKLTATHKIRKVLV